MIFRIFLKIHFKDLHEHAFRFKSFETLNFNKKYYNAIAAGGVNASTEDMGKYMKMLLGYRPDVLSPMGLEEVFKDRVQVGGRRNYYQRWPGYKSSHYALGWRHHTFEDETTGETKNITITAAIRLHHLPYFFLIGQSNSLALSRLTLSGQLFSGAKR